MRTVFWVCGSLLFLHTVAHTNTVVNHFILNESRSKTIEAFLPFDLEFTYGAAIYLAMADALFPDAQTPEMENHSQIAHAILDEMIFRGNRLANERKAELMHLETLFQEFRRQMDLRPGLPGPEQPEGNEHMQGKDDNANPNHNHPGASPSNNIGQTVGRLGSSILPSPVPISAGATSITNISNAVTGVEVGPKTAVSMVSVGNGNDYGQADGHGTDQFSPSMLLSTPSGAAATANASDSNMEFLDTIGISAHEFLSIVDQIEHHDSRSMLDLQGPGREEDGDG